MGWVTRRFKIPDKKKPKGLTKDILEKNEHKTEINLGDAKKLLEQKKKKSNIEFLIDENVLGIDRYLSSLDIKYRKVGDPDCPALKSDDPTVAKFAKEHNLVVVTNDDKLQKQCDPLDVDCVIMDLRDLTNKVKKYADSH